MSLNVKETQDKKKNNLINLLGKKKREELVKILEFGEKHKAEGEILKQQFWGKYKRELFIGGLIKYEELKKLFVKSLKRKERKILERLDGVSKEKFFDEYLHDEILYGQGINGIKEEKKYIEYNYEDWEQGNVEIKEGVTLDFQNSEIGDDCLEEIAKDIELKEGVVLNLYRNEITKDGAKHLAKMELKEGVVLNLGNNEIGNEGAKFLADKMKLKKGVTINFRNNKIGDKGIKAIVNKMELDEGVHLEFYENEIGDEGAQAIIDGFKLKNRVIIGLNANKISDEMKKKLKEWGESYVKQGVACLIVV